MLKKDLKKLIKDSEHKEWLNGLTYVLDLKVGQATIELNGFYDIYFFIDAEQKKWENGIELKEISVFEKTKKWFGSVALVLVRIIDYTKDNRSKSSLIDVWNELKGGWNPPDEKKVYLRDFSEAQFIIDLHRQNQKYAIAADSIFTDSLHDVDLNNKDMLFGVLMTYEFKSISVTEISSRKEIEEENTNTLRTELDSLLRYAKDKSTSLQSELEDLDLEHRKLLKSYREKSNKKLEETESAFYSSAKKLEDDTDVRFRKHEETYKELLKLKEPAKHWETRSKELLKAANWWLVGLLAASISGFTIIGFLVFSLQGNKFNESINNPAISIRWSILSVILLTLIAFLVRTFTKMMMSNFHLYRDAQERSHLTYLYMSLINETDINDADRNVVLQSLFSRVDTGLLKDDSGPTMPVSMIDKFNGH